MTQAFNLSQLANFVNTSGQIDASTALVNTISPPNGGTGVTTGLTVLNASNLTSGTVNRARLPAGSVLQVVQFATNTTGTFGVNARTALPGGFQLTITPYFSTSKILITANINVSGTSDARYTGFWLMRNSIDLATGDKGGNNGTNVTWAANQQGNTGGVTCSSFSYLDSPATTSAIVYSVEGQADMISGGRTAYFNRPENLTDNMRLWTSSTLIAMEIAG